MLIIGLVVMTLAVLLSAGINPRIENWEVKAASQKQLKIASAIAGVTVFVIFLVYRGKDFMNFLLSGSANVSPIYCFAATGVVSIFVAAVYSYILYLFASGVQETRCDNLKRELETKEMKNRKFIEELLKEDLDDIVVEEF